MSLPPQGYPLRVLWGGGRFGYADENRAMRVFNDVCACAAEEEELAQAYWLAAIA